MKKHLSKKRVVLAVLVVVMLAIASGVAYAYWTSGGTGTSSATACTTTGITVHQTAPVTVTGLYPGATPVTLSGNFDNSNSGTVHITSVTAAVTAISGAGTDLSKPVCATTDFAIAGSFAPAGGYTVPTGTAVGAWTGLTVQLLNGVANQDNCKGASATITYTVNP